jgi:hypothetical protein
MTQPARTIKDLADSARRRGIDYLGEFDFARLCLNFEKTLPDESLNAVLHLMIENQDARSMELGCIWLDGAGYGDRPVEWLAVELARAKQNQT